MIVAKCLNRLDASFLCLFKARYTNQQVDDGLRCETRNARAACKLNGQSERAESILDPGALLLEQARPVGLIVGDNDRSCSVSFHPHPVMVYSCTRNTKER